MSDATNQVKTPRALKRIHAWVFMALLLVLFGAVCWLFEPFFTILLWSVVLYIILAPLHGMLARKIDPESRFGVVLKNIAAGVFALLAILIVAIPLIFIATQFSRQILELINSISDTFRERPKILQDIMASLAEMITELSGGAITITQHTIQTQVIAQLNSFVQNAVQYSSAVFGQVSGFVVSLCLMFFSLFFFFLDGPYLVDLFKSVLPIRKDYASALVTKFRVIAKNLIMGYIIVALMQAVIAYIVFNIFKVHAAMVFAILTFFCVFIPMFGGALVWVPLGIIRIVTGDAAGGVLFMVVAGACISLLDNLWRPIILQDRIKLHPLIIFFAIMGGVRWSGINGIIVGPMLVILFLTVLEIFVTDRADGGTPPVQAPL
jgi:predicted PurR-regulated permease PerM